MESISRNALVWAVVLILFVVCGSIVALVLLGRDAGAVERTIPIIIALVGPVLAALVVAIQNGQIKSSMNEVKKLVNGHLDAHMQQSAAAGYPIEPVGQAAETREQEPGS